MSIASRIEAIEQHLTDDYNVLEVAGADLTNVDKNILNLKTTWQERLLYFMNNGTDVVWNNWDKVTGEGEQISLNNTLEGKMKIDLKGNTYQDSTTGKQLFNMQDKTGTTDGVTWTAINGILKISGTNTNTTAHSGWSQVQDLPSFSIGEAYTIRAEGLATGEYLQITYYTGSVYKALVYVGSTKVYNFTIPDDFSRLQNIFLGINGSATTLNNTIKLMLVKGTYTNDNMPDYEPYTNGASPNPDYPQDVNVVTGDNSINVCGKNLISTIDIFNGYPYATNGTALIFYSSVNSITYKKCCYVAANQEYTISWNRNTPKLDGVRDIKVADENEIQLFNYQYTSAGGVRSVTFTSPYSGWVYASLDANATDVQIEKGSSATTYEPYTGESYPINLGDIELCKIGDYQDRFIRNSGKNLFDKNSTLENGYIDSNGTATVSNNYKTTDYIPIKPNTTYVTSVMTNPGSNPSRCYYDENKTFISGEKHYGATTMVGTSPNNAKYMRESIPVVDIDKVQIEEGSSATDYEPYGNGDWYLEKNTGKMILNGTENWSIQTSWSAAGDKTNAFYITRPTELNPGQACYCDYLKYASNVAAFLSTDEYGVTYSASLILRMPKTLTDGNALKTYLASNNMKLYYALLNPTYTKIEGTLESQLNALAKSYTGQTNISQESNDLASILNATALEEMA